jgi:hypothetical protein
MGRAHGTWRRCGSGFGPWGTRRPAPGARGTEQQRLIHACVDGQQATRDAVRSVPHDIYTSYVKRQNLTMRMAMRRFTRLTNAFSKKLANLKAALALHFAHYNFLRVHGTLRVTPAMEAGMTDHVWTWGELLSCAVRIEGYPRYWESR